MTICIGAICEERKKAVFALDRMLTSRELSLEFEHDERKIDEISDTCVALTAGEALAPTKLFRDVKAKISKTSSIAEICDITTEVFRQYKMKRVEEKFFKPRDLTIEKFYQIQKSLVPEVVMRLERAIETEHFGVHILLLGVDRDGGHIYNIVDPGTSECHDKIGFDAIGSGLPHAVSTFVDYNYAPNLNLKKALYVVYEAKKGAERAPGVGTITDMGIVDEKGIKYLSLNELNGLQRIFEKKAELVEPSLEEIEKMTQELPLGE